MSDRTRGSRSGGSPGSRRSSSRGSGGSWNAWDEDDDYGHDYGRGEPRRSSRAQPPSSRAASRGGGRYDDYDEYNDPPQYEERRPRSQGVSRGGGRALAPAPSWNAAPAATRTRGGYNRRADDTKPGSSRVWLTILAVLLVVIVLAVLGIVVVPGHLGKPAVVVPDSPFATLTPGPTATVDSNFKAFQSDRSKYAIVYPQAWNATSDQRTTQNEYDYIDTFALQNAPSRLVVEQAGAFTAYTDQQIITNEAANAQQNGVTFTKAESQTPTQKVGGATWTRVDYSVNANGNPVNMVILACHHNGRGYVIVLVSTAAEFGNDDQSVFEPMLASFLFL